MNKIITIVILSVGFGHISTYAQVARTGGEDTLKTRIVTVFDYKPTISDAKKLSESPSIIDTTVPKPEANYLFDTRQFGTVFQPDTIKPANMKGEPLDPLYCSYIKGGVGNGVNYMLDGYVNAVRSRDGAIGVDVHGKGTQGVLVDVPPANYNRWATSIYGKRFFKKHELSGTVGFDRERLQYYGYSYSDTISAPYYLDYQGNEDVFKQVYTEVYSDVALKSFYTDSSKINHELNLHYDYFSDNNGANNEHNVVFNGSASRFLGMHQAQLGVLVDHNRVDYASDFHFSPFDTVPSLRSNTIVGFNPKLVSQAEKWRLELGVKVQLNVQPNSTEIKLYPDLYAKYNLVKEVIIPYAGFTGGLRRNNFNNLTEVNPFLWPSLAALRNTDRSYHLFGGFRGSVSQRFTYNLSAGQYHERTSPLFVNYDASQFNPLITPFGQNYFVLLYDTITTFEISGELTYRVGEKLQVLGSGVFRSFTVKNEAAAWHRPNFEVTGSAFYQLRNKIILKAELHVLGPQKAKAYKAYDANDSEAVDTEFYGGEPISVVTRDLKPIIDASLGVEYRYTERLSGFVNVNNLLVQRYQRWNQYPVQRFNVLAGISYAFWKE